MATRKFRVLMAKTLAQNVRFNVMRHGYHPMRLTQMELGKLNVGVTIVRSGRPQLVADEVTTPVPWLLQQLPHQRQQQRLHHPPNVPRLANRSNLEGQKLCQLLLKEVLLLVSNLNLDSIQNIRRTTVKISLLLSSLQFLSQRIPLFRKESKWCTYQFSSFILSEKQFVYS